MPTGAVTGAVRDKQRRSARAETSPRRSPGRAGLPPAAFFGPAIALVVLLLAVGGVTVIVTRDTGGPGPGRAPGAADRVAGSGPIAGSYSQVPSTGVFDGIADRSADPAPLTEQELFGPSARIVLDSPTKAKLTLRDSRLDQDCAQAVWGTGVADALGSAGCTQAARALYADLAKGYAATVTVFNLKDVAGANALVEFFDRRRGGGFVLPLPAKAPLDRFGSGFGAARGVAMGHFAVVSWVRRVDGKGDEQDEALLSLLVKSGESPAVLGRAAERP